MKMDDQVYLLNPLCSQVYMGSSVLLLEPLNKIQRHCAFHLTTYDF